MTDDAMDYGGPVPQWMSPRAEEVRAEMEQELHYDPDAIRRSPQRFYPFFLPDPPESDDENYYDIDDIPSPTFHRSPKRQRLDDSEAETHVDQPDSPEPNNIDDDASTEDFTQFYDLEPLSTHRSRKLRSDVLEYKATIKNSDHLSGERMLFRLKHILASMLQQAMGGLKDEDFCRLIIRAEGLKRPIAIAYTRVNELDLTNIHALIERVMQSNDTIRLTSSFIVNIARTHWPEPGLGRASGGLRSRHHAIFERWLTTKKCIINVPAEDGICGYLAVVLGKAIADGQRYQDIRKKTRWQRAECEALAAMVGLDLQAGLNVDGMVRIQAVLPEYQLAIYEPDAGAADSLNVLFRGESRDKHIDLLFYNAHYYVVKSMKAFYGTTFFCYVCYKAYDKTHYCTAACKFCQSVTCRNKATQRTIYDAEPCEQCGMEFKTQHCIAGHLDRCALYAKCPECLMTWPRKKLEPPQRHHCMERYCRSCKRWRPRFTPHQCYIATGSEYSPEIDDDGSSSDREDETDDGSSVGSSSSSAGGHKLDHQLHYIDFETTVMYEDKHFASILCVCQHESGEAEKRFEGVTAADDFLTYITEMDYRSTRRTFIAHYAQGFDTYCYLKKIYERKLKINIISKGQKITCLSMMNGRLRMIDSLAYLPMPLADFSGAFGIKEAKKGFFPYGLLRCREGEQPEDVVERLKRPIPFPGRDQFDERSMMPKRRQEFEAFYAEASAYFTDHDYIPWTELVEYCVADVQLLRLACNTFKALYQEHMQIDCFSDSFTLTSANFQAFCKRFTPKDKIAIIGDMGLMRGQFSRICLVWLESLAKDNMIQIKHAMNGGEERIGPYSVDGYSEFPPRFTHHNRRWKDAPFCYQFHGCLWHGCRKCVRDRSQMFMGLTADQRYANTMRMEKYLRDRGYNLIVEWSCNFEPIMKQRPELLLQARQAGALQPRILPRQAYFGGRVEAFKLYHKCQPGYSIRYFDINGLYPYIMLTSDMYVGVPEIIRCNFKDPAEYRGLVYGRFVSKRRDLFLPVLPCREGGKLYFSNCLTCVKEKTTTAATLECGHSDEERAITSIVTTEELALARSKGYEILELYEVWHYPPEQRDSQIFHKFESTWMGLKATASGWPASVADNDEAKQRYMDEYRRRFGIIIDPSKVRKNSALKTTAKLSGSALYGRLGLRGDRTNVTVAHDFEDLRRLLTDKNLEIKDIFILNDETSIITWSYKEGAEPAHESINLVMCIQITSYARMQLYGILDAVHHTPGCQLLYTDTDSVIFVAPEEGFQPPFVISDILGDLKDESAEFGPQARITDWFATGSKSYGFNIEKPDAPPQTVMKLKGFRLDYATRQVITPEAVIKMVHDQDPEQSIEVEYPRRIVREMKTGTMRERDTRKRYRLTADKRIVRPDFVTIPYGYITPNDVST